MKLQPLWTALIISTLFCLPRLIVPGGSPSAENHIIIRIPVTGLSVEQVRSSVEPAVIDALDTVDLRVQTRSVARPEELLVSARFPPNSSTSDTLTEVQRRLFALQSRLPYQAGPPTLYPVQPAEAFITVCVDFHASLLSRHPDRLKLEAEQLREQITRSARVRSVSVRGTPAQELSIVLDRDALVQRRIPPGYILHYLQQCLFDYYSGRWNDRILSQGIQMESSIRTAEDLSELQIPLLPLTGRRKLLPLGTIAKVKLQTLPATHEIYGADLLISVYTAGHVQIRQQLSLLRHLNTVLGTNDAVKTWFVCGGHLFSSLRCCSLLAALCCTGLFLTLVAVYLHGGNPSAGARQYTLVWALFCLCCVLLQYPCPLPAGVAFALAIPTTVTAAGRRRKSILQMQFHLAGSRAGLLPAWIICGILSAALLMRALLLLPLPRVFNIEVPSGQAAAVQYERCREILPAARVCGVSSRPHRFSRAARIREYWNSCAHPNRLQLKLLLTPADALRLEVQPDHPVRARESPAQNGETDALSFTLDLKSHTVRQQAVSRRDIYSQLDLAVNGRVVGTISTGSGSSLRLPVRVWYGRLESSEQLKQLPIFINDHRTVRLEKLCRLHPPSESNRQ